jgi:hypothetical protein
LKTLKKFINDSLKKKIIKKSILLTKVSVLFVLKLNKTKKLCVDYKKLNNITIKNKYVLLKANEIKNRLQKVKIFTQLNLKNVYYSVKIKAEKK